MTSCKKPITARSSSWGLVRSFAERHFMTYFTTSSIVSLVSVVSKQRSMILQNAKHNASDMCEGFPDTGVFFCFIVG